MKILSIALNTFRENLRDKLLYNLAGVCLVHDRQFRPPDEADLGEFHRLILGSWVGEH